MVNGNECAIGIAPKSYRDEDWQPGWFKNSLGYHSDDAGIFFNSPTPVATLENYYKGDVVGIGFMNKNKQIFITKNGKFLSNVCTVNISNIIKHQFYLCIGMWSNNTEVKVNFGSEQFEYDISTYDYSSPVVSQRILRSVKSPERYKDYLINDEIIHEFDANAFNNSNNNTDSSDEEWIMHSSSSSSEEEEIIINHIHKKRKIN